MLNLLLHVSIPTVDFAKALSRYVSSQVKPKKINMEIKETK